MEQTNADMSKTKTPTNMVFRGDIATWQPCRKYNNQNLFHMKINFIYTSTIIIKKR